jgi:hypothetical protein
LSWDDVARLVHRKGSSFPPVFGLWDGIVFGITSSSSKPASTVNGSMVSSFCRPLGVTLWSLSPPEGAVLIAPSPVLDVVHVDIAFGDCVLVGGFCYALILVYWATRYNWVYGLKDLSGNSILSALRLFKADAGSYDRCFRLYCNTKLFGTGIQEHLINNNSNILAMAAGWQLANGLVEWHWKTMVHMSHAYLTEKQMPHSFWFFLVVHSARMMNAIPRKLHSELASNWNSYITQDPQTCNI